jgi:hypothetical protein
MLRQVKALSLGKSARVKLAGGQHVGHKLAVIQRIQSILVAAYLLELVSAAAVHNYRMGRKRTEGRK